MLVDPLLTNNVISFIAVHVHILNFLSIFKQVSVPIIDTKHLKVPHMVND